MVQMITDGIKVSAEAFYRDEHSNPLQGKYMFGYRITIENLSSHSMKLMHSQWKIYDSNGAQRTLESEGIASEQPTIEAGEQFQYVAGCQLHSDMGKIKGSHLFEDLESGRLHKIWVPDFDLEAPFKNN